MEPTLNNIEAERVRNQMRQEDLAKEMGVSWKTYYNWIHEETNITGAALIKLKEIFHKDIDYLMEGSVHAGGRAAPGQANAQESVMQLEYR